MDRLKSTALAVLVIAILLAPTASAQATAANLTIVSGNGQISCPTCSTNKPHFFYPLVVKATDANGAPIAGKVINWQVSFSTNATLLVDPTSVTDSTGIATANISQGSQNGSVQLPFLQSTVLATVDNLSVTFYATQALTQPGGAANSQLVFSRLDSPPLGNFGYELSGPAGSTSTTPILIHIDAGGVTPVPNASVRLLNNDPNHPDAFCATQPGADPGSVLTDSTGNATCNPIFGTTPIVRNTVAVLVGGLDPANYAYPNAPVPLLSAVAYEQKSVLVTITSVAAAGIRVSSGNNQSINPGSTSAPLVALVTDSTGTVPVANTNVVWSVTPSTGAALTSTSSTSNAAGQAQTSLTLQGGASGQYTVRAALASNTGVATTFTVNANVQISSMTKISGDAQTVQANQSFGAPLVVQVNGNNGLPSVGSLVSFAISGPGTLSSNTASTDGNGRAQVTVRALGTAGTVTVSASISNIVQTFTLTVVPPGPSLTSGSFINAAGRNSALSPCGLATAVASGLAPGANGLTLQSNQFGPWGTTLAGDTVTVNGVAAPIFSVGTVNGVEQVTFQIPCEATVGNLPVTISVGGGSASANMNVTSSGPGIFETVMSDGATRAVALRPDGTFVSLQNPARRGEIIRVLTTGLGPTVPSVGTGALPVPGSDALVNSAVVVGVNNSGTRVITSRLSPNLIGVYEIAFQVPTDAITGNDVVLSVTVNSPDRHDSNGSKLPIQ